MDETFGSVINYSSPMSDEYNPKTGGYTYKIFIEDEPRLLKAAKIAKRKRPEMAKLLLQRALDLFEKDFKVSENAPPVFEIPPVADAKENTGTKRVPKKENKSA